MRTTDHTVAIQTKNIHWKDTFSFYKPLMAVIISTTQKKHPQLLLLKINILGKNDN